MGSINKRVPLLKEVGDHKYPPNDSLYDLYLLNSTILIDLPVYKTYNNFFNILKFQCKKSTMYVSISF